MITYIRNLIVFPFVKLKLSSYLKTQKKSILTSLNVDILESRKKNDSSLDETDYKKMKDYYGLAVPVMVGESFCLLRGKEMSVEERLTLTCLGGLTGLFDDFFDKKNIPDRSIKNLLENPKLMRGENSSEKLILKLYLKALRNLSDTDRLTGYSLEIYKAQVLSKRQFRNDIDKQEINDITLQKGGYSVLFYLCSFNEKISETEKELFYKLGGIWQIENDLLDVYKDHKSGIKTLVTTEIKIKNLRISYIQQVNQLVKLVLQTGHSVSCKRKFLDNILMFISIGFVAMDVLEKNEKKTNNRFELDKYERKDLICDIENPANILKIIHYFAKYNPSLSSDK